MNGSLSPRFEEVIKEHIALAERDRLAELRAAIAIAEEEFVRGEVVPHTPHLFAEIRLQAKKQARKGAQGGSPCPP